MNTKNTLVLFYYDGPVIYAETRENKLIIWSIYSDMYDYIGVELTKEDFKAFYGNVNTTLVDYAKAHRTKLLYKAGEDEERFKGTPDYEMLWNTTLHSAYKDLKTLVAKNL